MICKESINVMKINQTILNKSRSVDAALVREQNDEEDGIHANKGIKLLRKDEYI